MTTTEPIAQVQVHPGVPSTSVAADVVRKANEALELIAKVNADLDRVDELASEVRGAFHALVIGLAPHYRGLGLDWVDGPAEGIGWTPIWTALIHLADRYNVDRYHHLDVPIEELEVAAEVQD